MTETSINATTLKQLHIFERRRRLFGGIRGGLVALAVLLIVFFIIATIDWLIVMQDGVRWGLTLAGYLLAVVAAWKSGVREFVRSSTEAEVAISMECEAPELREELLSAVELAHFDPETVRDSVEFRELVQASVAEQVANVEPERLLPWSRLKQNAIAAGGGLALVVILALAVGIGFASRLMMRAAVPGADIARITGVDIEILEPAPASLITRAGDPVTLRFRVSKPEVRVVELTLKTEGRERSVQLRPVEPGHFETTLHPNRAPIDYSLTAGDAVTATHRIDPHTPPVILDFSKQYEFPEYLGREPQTIRERDGHLKAIEGTTVRLQIVTDQPSIGEIRLTVGGETKTIPLKDVAELVRVQTSDRRGDRLNSHESSYDGEYSLTADIPITDSGRYQVHLTGARSKLPAEFAPTYQVTAHPDKAPRIRLIKPDTERVVQPDSVIPVQAQAEDDFGIARVEQWLSRNGGEEWEKFPVVLKAGRQTPVAFNWDLLKHNLDAGDLITMKLVAFDGRGELAESREVDLTINFRDLDPERLTGLRARERAFSVLDDLNENSSVTLEAFRNGLKDGPPDLTKLYELDREAWSALGLMKTPLQNIPPGRDAYDLNLAARSAAIGRHLGIRQAIRRATFAKNLRKPDARKAHVDATSTDASAAMRRYSAGREMLRSMIAEELSRVALADFLDLRRQTDLLLPEQQPSRESSHESSIKPTADELRRFGRVLGLTLHRAKAITEALAEFEVSWRNTQAGKLHDIAGSIGPPLESLTLDLESLRADDRRSRSAINELGPWWQLGAIPFVSFDATFHRQFAPELAIELSKPVEGRRWAKVADWEEGTHRELAQPGTVVYLFRTVTASKENEVEAEITCREGVTVWLNGEVWIQSNNVRTRDGQRYGMTLRPGQNNLLVKLVNKRHPHPFSFRIDNTRLEGNVDALATQTDKLQFLSRETKLVLDDAIRALQPVLIQMAALTERRRVDNEREASETRSLAVGLQRFVGRSIFYGIGQENGKQVRTLERDFLKEVPQVRWTPYTDALDSFAWLDEIRPDADTSFCRATGLMARALESMQPEFVEAAKATKADFPDTTKYSAPTQARRQLDERMKLLCAEFHLLERAFEIREIERTVRELAAQEEWRSQGPEPRTRHPFEWQFIADRLETVGLKLSQGSDAVEAGTALLDVLASASANQVSREMQRRLTTLESATSMRPQLAEIRISLKSIIDSLKQRESDSLAAIKDEAPKLTELLATTADATRALATRTRKSVVELADAEETVAFARTRELFLNQQRNGRLVRNVMNALRQDANSQNVLLAEGRERSRDVDTALEWLRLPAKLSASAFEDALFAETARDQRHFLEDGGLNQGEIANRLDALLRHFQSLDAGESTTVLRADLRELEIEFDLRERLDREYGQLERVAAMAKLNATSELIAALEGELDGNGAMQRELDSLTRNAVQDSLTGLQHAAMTESSIRQRLHAEAVRQGEIHPPKTKSELRDAIPVAKADVDRLRQTTAQLRESFRSLRAQHQQLRQRHDQFERARSDFMELELPAVAKLAESFGHRGQPKVLATFATGHGQLTSAVRAFQQISVDAQEKLRAENADLSKLDLTDEIAESRSVISLRRDSIEEMSEVPPTARDAFSEARLLIENAVEDFPTKHAGDLRVASQLYQRSNDLRNAAARLEAASEATLDADRHVIAASTQLKRKPRKDLMALVAQFRELAENRLPATMKNARDVGATDAATNYELAKKAMSAAMQLVPSDDASLLILSQNLDQLGMFVREAGLEVIRGSRAMGVQIEGPARVAYHSARAMADNIRRVENQARQQRDLQVRAIAATRPRGRLTLPEDEKQKKLQEAEAAGKRAADLTRQAERMSAAHKGKVEQTKSAIEEVTAAVAAGNECGKQAQQLGDQFRQLADTFEEQVAALQPRENSEAGRTARQLATEVDAVNELAKKIEALALRIHPNLHTPSETELAARQADEALEKATLLLAEEKEISSGPHPDDLLSQISRVQQADSAARDEFAAAEQRLRQLQAFDALPEPDPNPERARQTIATSADEQSQVRAPVVAAAERLIRAALHEQRLGNVSNAEELGRIGRRVHALAESGITEKADQIRSSASVQGSREIADSLEKSIRAQMQTLRVFLFPESDVQTRVVAIDDEQMLTADLLSERETEVSEQLAQILFQIQKQVPQETLLAQLELSEQGTQATVETDVEIVESTPPEPNTSPENTPAQPENAPDQPENAPNQPENTPAQPENAPNQPENAPAQPENAPNQSENTPAQPENAPNQPENTPAQPENAPNQPENTPAQPENAPAELLPVTPGLAEAIEEVAEAQAEALNEMRNAEDYALPAVELDETVIERDSFSDDLDRLAHLRDRNWNAFREEGEKDLSLGNNNSINGIYRDAIEAYFRVISRGTETKRLTNANER